MEHDDDVFQGRALREEPRGTRLPWPPSPRRGRRARSGSRRAARVDPHGSCASPRSRRSRAWTGPSAPDRDRPCRRDRSFPAAAGLAGDLDAFTILSADVRARRKAGWSSTATPATSSPRRQGSSGKTGGFRRHPARDPRRVQRPKWLNLHGPFGLWPAQGAQPESVSDIPFGAHPIAGDGRKDHGGIDCGNEREARAVAREVGGILPCVGRFGWRTRSCRTGALDLPRGRTGPLIPEAVHLDGVSAPGD